MPHLTRDQRQQRIWSNLTLQVFTATSMIVDVDWGRDWRVEPHQNHHWRIMIMEQEGACITVGDREIAVSPRHILLLPEQVGFQVLARKRIPHFFVIFSLRESHRPLWQGVLGEPYTLKLDDHLRALLDICLQAAKAPREQDLATCALASALVWSVLGTWFEQLPKPVRLRLLEETRSPNPLQPALDLIHSRFSQPPGVPELASTCHMSLRSFQRKFQQQYGMPPSRYGLQERLKHAANCLLFENRSLEDIAEKTGFTDRFHLGHQFRKFYGIPPALYRRTLCPPQ